MHKNLLKFLTFCFCFIFGFRIVAEAQYGSPPAKIDIKGKVKDEKNFLMKNIDIKVKNPDDSARYITNTHTDENGDFTINIYDFYIKNELEFEFYNPIDKTKIYDTILKINKEQLKLNENKENKELKEPLNFKISNKNK